MGVEGSLVKQIPLYKSEADVSVEGSQFSKVQSALQKLFCLKENGLLKELNVLLFICCTKESSRRLVLQLQLILPKKLTVLKAL